MADISKSIQIIFGGKDEVSGTVASISGKLGGLSTGFNAIGKAGEIIEDIAAPFAKLANGILAVEAAIGGLAAGGLAYAVYKTIDFEAASADLNKVLGDESERLGEAQDKALELSQAYGVGSSEILASMANFKQAGFNLTDSMTLTKSALDLVIAGDLEAAEASDILVASLKGFKAPAEDSIRLTDLLNEVSNNYATNVRELGVGMANLSPIANKMGFSFEETAGALTPVIEIFRSGDEAAVALKTGLLKLIDDSKPVQDALASIGVSQEDANGALRSGKDILYDVSVAFQGLDQNQKMYVASQLVGIHQAGKMVEVFDGLGKSTEVTAAAMNAAGSAANEVKIRLETAEIAVKRFKVGFENLGIAVGGEFLEATKDVIEGGTSIEEKLRTLVKQGTFDPVFGRVRDFGEDFGEMLDGIAEALPLAFETVDFAGLLDSLDNLKESFRGTFNAIFGDLDLTKPEDLAKAIQKVVDSLTSLTNITAGIVERINPVIKMFVDWTAEVNKWDADSQRAAGNRLADALIIQKFGGIFGSILIALTGSVNDLHGAMAELDILGDPFAVMADGADEAADEIDKVPDKMTLLNAAVDEAKKRQIAFTEAQEREVSVLDEYSKELFRLGESVKAVPAGKEVKVEVTADTDSVQQAWNYIEYKLPGGKTIREYIEVDPASLTEAKKTVDENVPAEKLMQIQADIDVARLKEQSAIVQTAIEWEAKLEITKAESDLKKFVALVDSVVSGFESTADVLGNLFGVYLEADTFKSGNIESWIREEQQRRQQEFEIQEKLTNAQLAYMAARTNALSRGDALIRISGDGLAPELEAFMWAVLSRIQVRATQEGADLLVGL